MLDSIIVNRDCFDRDHEMRHVSIAKFSHEIAKFSCHRSRGWLHRSTNFDRRADIRAAYCGRCIIGVDTDDCVASGRGYECDARARRYFRSTMSIDDKGSFAVPRTHAPLTALQLSAFHFFQLNAPDILTETEAHVRRSETLRACFFFEYSTWAKIGFMTIKNCHYYSRWKVGLFLPSVIFLAENILHIHIHFVICNNIGIFIISISDILIKEMRNWVFFG